MPNNHNNNGHHGGHSGNNPQNHGNNGHNNGQNHHNVEVPQKPTEAIKPTSWTFEVDGDRFSWAEDVITRSQIEDFTEQTEGKALRYKVLDANGKVVIGLQDFPVTGHFDFMQKVEDKSLIVSFEFYGQANVS